MTDVHFCHMMFNKNQPRIERSFNESFKMPVLHYPQLLGLIGELSPDELALRESRVGSTQIISRISERMEDE